MLLLTQIERKLLTTLLFSYLVSNKYFSPFCPDPKTAAVIKMISPVSWRAYLAGYYIHFVCMKRIFKLSCRGVFRHPGGCEGGESIFIFNFPLFSPFPYLFPLCVSKGEYLPSFFLGGGEMAPLQTDMGGFYPDSTIYDNLILKTGPGSKADQKPDPDLQPYYVCILSM